MQNFQDTFETRKQSFICAFSICMTPANTDVFKTSSGRLGKVTTSYDQIRRRQNVWKKRSDIRHLADV